MHRFTAKLEIIGINPFVPVPENVLDALISAAGKNKGPIPIKGSINGVEFQQTLVKYRSIRPHPKLIQALEQNKQAKEKFDTLPPSLQKEIVRYISFLKTETSIDRNIAKAIDFLMGKGSFVGRNAL